jgi:uncharacterized protein with HEPN domain
MRPEERDAAFLWDMRDAAREVLEFTRGITYARFTLDRVLRYAVERQILVIGEAARRVSPAFKEAHPEIPKKTLLPPLRNWTSPWVHWMGEAGV